MTLGSLLMTFLIRAPGKQHTSLESATGWQMGASIALRRELPTTITRHLLLVALVVIQGTDWLALLRFSVSPDVTGLSSSSLQSSEAVLQGHLRLQGKSLRPAGPCHCKLPFFHTIGPLPFHVCQWGSFWLCGHGSTADCTWSQPSNSFSASLMLRSLLTTSCSSAPAAGGPTPGSTFCGQGCCLSLPHSCPCSFP